MAGKRRAGCAAEWRAQPFIVLGIAVFTAGLKRLARNMAQQTPIHQLIKKQKTLKIGLGLQSETACRRVDAVFAHFGRAVAPLKWARAIRTEPLRGISTSFVVYRPGKDAPDLQQSIDCRDPRLVSKVEPICGRICLSLATQSDLRTQHYP